MGLTRSGEVVSCAVEDALAATFAERPEGAFGSMGATERFLREAGAAEIIRSVASGREDETAECSRMKADVAKNLAEVVDVRDSNGDSMLLWLVVTDRIKTSEIFDNPKLREELFSTNSAGTPLVHRLHETGRLGSDVIPRLSNEMMLCEDGEGVSLVSRILTARWSRDEFLSAKPDAFDTFGSETDSAGNTLRSSFARGSYFAKITGAAARAFATLSGSDRAEVIADGSSGSSVMRDLRESMKEFVGEALFQTVALVANACAMLMGLEMKERSPEALDTRSHGERVQEHGKTPDASLDAHLVLAPRGSEYNVYLRADAAPFFHENEFGSRPFSHENEFGSRPAREEEARGGWDR